MSEVKKAEWKGQTVSHYRNADGSAWFLLDGVYAALSLTHDGPDLDLAKHIEQHGFTSDRGGTMFFVAVSEAGLDLIVNRLGTEEAHEFRDFILEESRRG